jgi:hypothetical protein
MELFGSWPLWHYRTLRGLLSTGSKFYYNIDLDVFLSSNDANNLDKNKYRISDVYLIVGLKATVNNVYTYLGKKQVPPIPDAVLSEIQKHVSQDSVLRALTQNVNPTKEKEQTTSSKTYVPSILLDISKISNALTTILPTQCVNILTASKVTLSPIYVPNTSSKLCYPKAKLSTIGNVQELFKYVEEQLSNSSNTTKQTLESISNVSESEKTKIDRINELTTKTTSIASSPKKSPRKSAPKQSPSIKTMEIDKLSESLSELRVKVEEHEQSEAPLTSDIIERINASENRTRTRIIPQGYAIKPRAKSPTKDRPPEILQEKLNKLEEEQNLFNEFKSPKQQRSKSPQSSQESLEIGNDDSEEYSSDEQEF